MSSTLPTSSLRGLRVAFSSFRARRTAWPLAAAAALLVLAACGGGGADTTPRDSVSRVVVFGDSLADVGTFGTRATIQGNDMYPERVAQSYGLGKGCNYYVATGANTFAPNPTAGCSNFAIGGGVINPATLPPPNQASDPRGVRVQLAAAAPGSTTFGAGDLLLIDGGGNDAAALVGAYLKAQPAPAATAAPRTSRCWARSSHRRK